MATVQADTVKRGRPKRSERNDSTVRVDTAILTKATFIAKEKGIPLAEYFSEMVRGTVDRDFDRAVKRVRGEAI